MISKIFILAGVIAVVQGTLTVCPRGEVLSISTCSDKCSDMGSKCTITLGKLKCKCKLGKKRNDMGTCVPKRECCTGQNEEYCTSGSDKTCDSIARTIFFPPLKHKNEGCFCIEGTVRNGEGKCVFPSECIPQCNRDNEVYKSCGCESTCSVDGENPDACVGTPGCYCKSGYVRIGDDCTDPSNCPCAGPNECYKRQGGCDRDCKGNKCDGCTGSPGCYCMDGYVRDPELGCIFPKHCKKHCSSCEAQAEGE